MKTKSAFPVIAVSLIFSLAMLSCDPSGGSSDDPDPTAPTKPPSKWSALGGGMNIGGSILALAFDSAGNLYAGGNFTSAGGTAAKGIAKWNGSSWSPLGAGLDRSGPVTVRALAFDSSGILYVGGTFETAGGTTVNNVAKWDTINSVWSPIGTPPNVGTDGDVLALVFDASGNLYVGGLFGTAGGTSANRVAKYNGGSWSQVGNGMNWPPNDLIFASGSLYAGGLFDKDGSGNTLNYMAKLDGVLWSPLGSGLSKYVNDMILDASGNLFVGGDFVIGSSGVVSHVAKWDMGTASWSAIGTGMHTDSTCFKLTFDSSGTLYAGGTFYNADQTATLHLLKWNNNNWEGFGTDPNGTVTALAFDTAGNLYIGGAFTTVDGVSVGGIAKWSK